MATKNKFYRRGFLNSDEGIAAFISTVDSNGDGGGDARFTVSDCNRQITLDFSWWDRKPFKTSLKKLDKLIDELVTLKFEMLAQGDK